MEPLPADIIKDHVSLSHELFPGCSKNIFVAIADDGNHFLDEGIREGYTLVFDRGVSHKSGCLSCFMDQDHSLHLLKRKKKNMVQLGRLVGIIASV